MKSAKNYTTLKIIEFLGGFVSPNDVLIEIDNGYYPEFPPATTRRLNSKGQLAYRAYRNCGIDLNSNWGVPDIPGTDTVIFPQEIWEGCVNRRV